MIKDGEITLRGCSPEEVAEIVPKGTILLGYRGSIAHGMYRDPTNPDSVDDKDIMGVCIPKIDNYFGLNHFEQKEKMLREWDSVVYELRKYVNLLVKANPNVLALLWLEPKHYIYSDLWGQALVENRDMFVTKAIYRSFTGYAYAQMKKMESATFEGYMGAKRKKLVEEYGYDTKNAAHCIRLLRMGTEFLNEGVLHVERHDAPQLMDIKLGRWSLEDVKAEANFQFKRAELAYDRCTLPNSPDLKEVNGFLVDLIKSYYVGHEGEDDESQDGLEGA